MITRRLQLQLWMKEFPILSKIDFVYPFFFVKQKLQEIIIHRIKAVTEDPNIIPIDTIDAVKEMESPRLIKSHLSYDMLPSEIESKEAKVFSEKKSTVFFLFKNDFFFSDNLRHQKSEGCLRLVLLFYWNL